MAWRGMYKVIGETNAFIANIADSPLESADKLPMEAAARFLRALAYYNLAVTYGDVPLKTTPSPRHCVYGFINSSVHRDQ